MYTVYIIRVHGQTKEKQFYNVLHYQLDCIDILKRSTRIKFFIKFFKIRNFRFLLQRFTDSRQVISTYHIIEQTYLLNWSNMNHRVRFYGFLKYKIIISTIDINVIMMGDFNNYCPENISTEYKNLERQFPECECPNRVISESKSRAIRNLCNTSNMTARFTCPYCSPLFEGEGLFCGPFS